MIRVRFAPSPTGLLHQGNVRTALFNFLFVRHQQGKMILRIEDTDQERSTAEFEAAILKDLRWLGINYDEGPDGGGEFGPYRQTERLAIYKKYLEELLAKQKAYPCFCSPEELEFERKLALASGKAFQYSGKCSHLTAEQVREKMNSGLSPSYRFRVESKILHFSDLVYGEKTFDTSSIGDFVIARANELPLYLFACAVDDCLMQITHVIRGEDGMSNTPRQILIQQELGFKPPQFAHLPLILGPDHQLLSKRNGSTSVGTLREQGYLPEAILNYLAMLGWSPPEGREILKMQELIALFDLSRVSRSSAVFDIAKLNFVNQSHLRNLSEAEYLKLAAETLEKNNAALTSNDSEYFRKILLALRGNLKSFSELPTMFSALTEEIKPGAEAEEVLKNPESRLVLEKFCDWLQAQAEDLSAEDYQKMIEGLKQSTQAKGKKLFMPLRIAMTGALEGPELATLLSALGKTRTLERVQRVLKNL